MMQALHTCARRLALRSDTLGDHGANARPACGADDHDRDATAHEILLVLRILAVGQQNFESRRVGPFQLFNAHSSNVQRPRRVLEHPTRLIRGDPREPLHDVRELRTVLEALEQRRNRHARPAKRHAPLTRSGSRPLSACLTTPRPPPDSHRPASRGPAPPVPPQAGPGTVGRAVAWRLRPHRSP